MADKPEIRPNPMQHAMLAGLELGFWMAVKFVIDAQSLRYSALSFLGTFMFLYVLWAAFVATQHYKITACEGKLSWGAAYKYVLCLYMCATLVASLLRYGYMLFLDTNYLPMLYERHLPLLQEIFAKMSPEEFPVEKIQTMYLPIRFTFTAMFGDMMQAISWGALIALIASRRTMKFFTQNNEDLEDE